MFACWQVIHDLDLTITAPDGARVFYANDDDTTSDRDNVEKVTVANTTLKELGTGNFMLNVTAHALLHMTQHFSVTLSAADMVVTGFTTEAWDAEDAYDYSFDYTMDDKEYFAGDDTFSDIFAWSYSYGVYYSYDDCVSAYVSLTCNNGSLMLSQGCGDDECSNCTLPAFDYTEYSGGTYYCDDTYYYVDSNLDQTPDASAELPSPSCYWESCDDDGALALPVPTPSYSYGYFSYDDAFGSYGSYGSYASGLEMSLSFSYDRTYSSSTIEVAITDAGNTCPDGWNKITSIAACRAAIDLLEFDGTNYGGDEDSADWPGGCYFCDDVAGCGDGFWFNHATGALNGNAAPVCELGLTPLNESTSLLFMGDSDVDYWEDTHVTFAMSNNVAVGGYTCQDVRRSTE